MPKKVSSTTQQGRSARNASKQHDWPAAAGLASVADRQHYLDLQQQRSHDDWTLADLLSLANLARLQSDAVQQTDFLRIEGYIVPGGKAGTTAVSNPRQRVVHDLLSSINSLARRLGLTSMSVTDKRSQAARGEQERQARAVLDDSAPRSGASLM